MQLFEFTKSLFEQPWKWAKFTKGDKNEHFFMTSRFMSIMFPLQALSLSHIRINKFAVMDFWQVFMRMRFNKVPFWMYIKGTVKKKEEKQIKIKVTNKQIENYAKSYNIEIKSVKELLNFWPEETVKDIKKWEKITK